MDFIIDMYIGSVIIAVLAAAYATYLDVKLDIGEGPYHLIDMFIMLLWIACPIVNIYTCYVALQHCVVKHKVLKFKKKMKNE